MTRFHARKQTALTAQMRIFLCRNWELASSALLGSHAYTSSSCNLHNCNFISQRWLGSLYAWFSQLCLLGVQGSAHYFKHLAEKAQTIIDTIITPKKKEKFSWFERWGDWRVLCWAFPPFCSPLLFKNSTCKTFVKPTQLWGPLTRSGLSTQYPF